jgi:hypothetical protein
MPSPNGLWNAMQTVTACFNNIPAGGAVVVFRGYDAQGNTSTGLQQHFLEQTVTIGANGECACPPLVIQSPANITRYTCNSSARVCYHATATGGCPLLTVTYNPPSCSFFAVGSTTLVTATVTDANGHTASTTFTVTVLPANFWQWFPAGTPDCYLPPFETAYRGVCLQSLSSSWKPFDSPAVNRHFGQTWNLPAGTYQAGWLYTRMKDAGADYPVNDSIHLGLVGCPTPTWQWGQQIDPVGVALGLPTHPWLNIPGCQQFFALNLGALPITSANLLPQMTASHRLDLMVEDDTRVDFAWLRLLRCPPPIIGGFETSIANAQLAHGPGSWILVKDAGATNFSATFEVGAAAAARLNFDGLSFAGPAGGSQRSIGIDTHNPEECPTCPLFRVQWWSSNDFARILLGAPLLGVSSVTVRTLSNDVVVASNSLPATADVELARFPASAAITRIDAANGGAFSVQVAEDATGITRRWIVIPERVVDDPTPLNTLTLTAEGFEQIALRQPEVGVTSPLESIDETWDDLGFTTVSGEALARVENGRVTLSALDAGNSRSMGLRLRASDWWSSNDFRVVVETSAALFSPVSSNASLSFGVDGTLAGGGGNDLASVNFLFDGTSWIVAAMRQAQGIPMHRVEIRYQGSNAVSVTSPGHVRVAALPKVYSPSTTWFVDADICHRLQFGTPVAIEVNGVTYLGDELRVLTDSGASFRPTLTGLHVESTGLEALMLSSLEVGPFFDTDGDGMPDVWEIAHGLNPNDPSDAAGDPDHDGKTNLEEYIAGTDPRNAADVFRVEHISVMPNGGLQLRFRVIPERLYEVEAVSALGSDWTTVYSAGSADIPADGVVLPPGADAPLRFFRCRVIPAR